MRRGFAIGAFVFAAHTACAQELTVADLSLAGMQLGKSTLQEVLSHFGIAPLRSGEVDELCYRSESPLLSYWVLFGAGDAGDYEKLAQFRVLTTPPPDITCPPSARLTPELATESGIRIGTPAKDLQSRLERKPGRPSLRIATDSERVTSFEVRLAE